MQVKLTLSVVSAGLVAVMVSCLAASAHKGIEPQPSVAIFDSFSYAGNDSCYSDSALTDESSFFNPVLPGWYSDPSICTNGNGDYFIVTSTFTYFPGVPIFHSRDLVNWKQVGHVLSRPSQLQNMEKQHVSGGIFAPDITYNPANKTYYMITTNVGAGNFFVKTQDPFGQWSDPVMLPEVQGIDPAFFFDEDGKGYIVNNDDAPDAKPEYPGHRTVRVVEFDTATDKCVGERRIVVNKGCRPEEKPIWCEGPHIYKIKGQYYLMTAEGGTGDWHSEVIYRGPTPFGPYTAWEGNPILTQRTLDRSRENPVTCAGHADLVQTKEGDWWSVFLACRPIKDGMENLGRETFMMPVKWTDDGWPYMTREGELVPMILKREGVKRGSDVTFGNFAKTDEFSDTTLGYEWMTLRGAAKNYYSLSKNPGFLTMKCADVSSADKEVLPFVCRRIHHHDYEASTRVTFLPEHDAQSAGLLMMKDETHQYYLAKTRNAGNHCIVLRKISENGAEDLASSPIDEADHTVDLKVKSQGLTLSFFYSADGGRSWKKVADGIDAGFTSTARAGGFTGTTVGMYASNRK